MKNPLPALTGGWIFTTSGVHYKGKNYYEFPYDAETIPSLRAMENILYIVEDMRNEGLRVTLEEKPNSWYWFIVKDSDDLNRVIREIDAHSLIVTFIESGTRGLEQVLNPDKRFSF